MIIRKCLTCEKEFDCYPSARRKYCSLKCVPENIGNASRWKNKVPVEFSCALCSVKFSVRPSRAKRGDVKYCSYKCHQIGEGRKGGEVRGEQIKQQLANWRKVRPQQNSRRVGGRLYTGKSYPKQNGRHIHRTVAEKKLGRPLLPGEVVHHIDENRQNYSEDNLQILANQADHARLHVAHTLAVRKPRKINKFRINCEECEKEFFVHKGRLQTAKHCSRLCHNRAIGRKKKNVPRVQQR